MDHIDEPLGVAPEFSIIIAVYNDWTMLDSCLESLTHQTASSFEAIVVDDGSSHEAPESIHRWGRHFQLRLIRQQHAGIASARNTGIRASRGALLLFVDADCRVEAGCLAELASIVHASPNHDFFQLRLVGDLSTKTGRAEELRLATIQQQTIQPDTRIRYLNTAAFAVRSKAAYPEGGLFNPRALRGEDTLLLVNLIRRGELPLFVPHAIVQHSVPSSLFVCLRKDIRSAYLQSGTYALISKTGVRIRMSTRDRLRTLRLMWRTAKQESIGRTAWFLLLARQMLERSVSLVCQLLRIHPEVHEKSEPS